MTAPPAPLAPDILDTLLREARSRPSYRGLYLHAAAVLAARREVAELSEDPDGLPPPPAPDPGRVYVPTPLDLAHARREAAETAAQAAAARIVRASATPAERRREVTLALYDLALTEAAQRPPAAAQRRAPRPPPPPSGPPWTIDPVHITRVQREEHNAIARALLHPASPSPRDRRLGERADLPTAELEVAWRRMHQSAMLAARYLLQQAPALAEHYARLAQDARLDYEATLRLANRDHRSAVSGTPYQDGDTHVVVLPDHDDPDLAEEEEFLFHLDIRWNADGDALTIDPASAHHAEALSGVQVGSGWADLARWIDDHHRRLVAGDGQGKRPEDHDHLIWQRQGEDSLTLRPILPKTYPGLIAALECLRCALRPA